MIETGFAAMHERNRGPMIYQSLGADHEFTKGTREFANRQR